MELRPFQAADLERLYEIDRACFPPGISYSRKDLANYVAGGASRTWVAHEGDAIVGFVIADLNEGGIAHIITLDVVEEWRRRGVGKALMDAAEDTARGEGAGMVYLETAEDNLAAQRFYQVRGYSKVKTIESYYSNGAAAWVMVKRLKAESRVDSRKLKGKASGI